MMMIHVAVHATQILLDHHDPDQMYIQIEFAIIMLTKNNLSRPITIIAC